MIFLLRVLALLACALVVMSEATPVLRLMAAIPLVFLLPGHALAMHAIPGTADPLMRVAWTLGLSVAVSVLLPIVTTLVGAPIDARMWVTGLVTVTLLAELTARLRGLPAAWPRPAVRTSRRSLGLLVLAGTVAAGGVALSLVNAGPRDAPTSTQLWMVPGTEGELRIGVRQFADGDEPLTLVLDDGSATREYPVPVGAGSTFELTWPLVEGVPVVQARLYSGDSPTPIREVFHRTDPQ